MANLFPAELDISGITVQVEQLAQLLSDVAAERYVLPTCLVHIHSLILLRAISQLCFNPPHNAR